MLDPIMGERYGWLREAVAGYAKTGIPLIGYGPKGLVPAGASDDIGIYYFIPAIQRAFQVSLDRAVELFLVGVLVLCLVVALCGAYLAFKTRRGRGAAALGILGITVVSYLIGDVYLMPSALVMAVVPWFLYALSDRPPTPLVFGIGFLAGCAIGTGHYVRAHAGTSALLFLIVLVLARQAAAKSRRVALSLGVSVGMLLPVIGFQRLLHQRDGYLEERGIPSVAPRHGFWHPVYLGFGFLENRHDIRYEDAVAYALVRQRATEVVIGSREYERILREEVFKLVKEDPRFVGQTLFAKLGVLLFYLAAFGGIGLVLALRRVNPRYLDLAFPAAITFSAIPAILVMPMASYLTGFMAWCILYGVVGVEYAAAKHVV